MSIFWTAQVPHFAEAPSWKTVHWHRNRTERMIWEKMICKWVRSLKTFQRKMGSWVWQNLKDDNVRLTPGLIGPLSKGYLLISKASKVLRNIHAFITSTAVSSKHPARNRAHNESAWRCMYTYVHTQIHIHTQTCRLPIQRSVFTFLNLGLSPFSVSRVLTPLSRSMQRTWVHNVLGRHSLRPATAEQRRNLTFEPPSLLLPSLSMPPSFFLFLLKQTLSSGSLGTFCHKLKDENNSCWSVGNLVS